MKRIPALVAASALVLAACGGGTDAAGEQPAATSSGVADALTTSAQGEPPLWGPSYDETAALEWAWAYGTVEDQSAAGMPDGCMRTDIPDEPATATFERCLVEVLAQRGASEAAIEIYRERRWTIFEVQGSGPVWVASFEDWSVDSNTLPGGQAIFTADGIVDAALAADALAEALGSPAFDRIQAAVLAATAQDVGYALLDAVIGSAEYTVFGPPVGTDAGWSVPVTMKLYGCHACTTAFAVKVAFDFASDGGFEGVRSLGFCWDPATDARLTWTDASALEAIHAELPTCDGDDLPVDVDLWTAVTEGRWR